MSNFMGIIKIVFKRKKFRTPKKKSAEHPTQEVRKRTPV
jgi:hypothetical protein